VTIDPPARKDVMKDPPLVIDPPLGVDPPMKKDPPIMIDPPLVIDPPAKKEVQKDPPTAIDPPLKKQPSTGDAAPKLDRPKTDGSYDEDLHTLKPQETYRSISRQYYNSEAYSTALQRYNRDNPSGQADYVRVPPIWVLEKKYPSDITGGPARVNYAPPPTADTPRAEPTYTVADSGEMLADVARKTLGSEDNWKRLWDMNPQLNPAKVIPAGTKLRLPQP
jgi:hypothetical protein